jgi:hypothetical protein
MEQVKRALAALFLASLAVAAVAESPVDSVSARHYLRPDTGGLAIVSPDLGAFTPQAHRTNNLTYHGGPTTTLAHVIFIFWGPSFGPGGADNAYATTLQAFRNQFGTTGEYNVITQYSGIQQTNLGGGTADMFDSSTPPTNVTDAIVQSEVQKYLASNAFDNSATYEVVIPSTSYSSDGGATSCGGPALQYCAYHGFFNSGSNAVKYSIEPYPSCSGCQVAGWTAVQNQEHFVCHESRESITDPELNAWYDSRGNEADDKCAWSPTPFIGTGGYSYQYEWSNANNGCVKTR